MIKKLQHTSTLITLCIAIPLYSSASSKNETEESRLSASASYVHVSASARPHSPTAFSARTYRRQLDDQDPELLATLALTRHEHTTAKRMLQNLSVSSIARQSNETLLKKQRRDSSADTADSANSLSTPSLAVQQDFWYRQATHLLKQEHEEECARYSFMREKPFQIPAPEETLCRLVDKYTQDKLDIEHRLLIKLGLTQLKSKKATEHTLALLNKDWNELTLNKKRFLLPLVHDAAIAHGQQEALGKALSKYISDNLSLQMCNNVSQEERMESENCVLQAFPLYHTFAAQEAEQRLKYLVNQKIEDLLVRHYSTDITLRYLVCARQVSPLVFNDARKTIHAKKLDAMLSLALQYPQTMLGLEGTELSIDSLIQAACARALQKSEELSSPSQAFETLLTEGQAFHIKHQDLIAQLIPQFLTTHHYKTGAVIALLQSPALPLRPLAFQAVVRNITTQKDNFWRESAIKNLFAAPLDQIAQGQTALDAYRYFDQECKRKNSIAGRQYLWMQLARRNRDDEKQLLAESMSDFFGISSGVLSTQVSFKDMLNRALKIATQSSVSRFNDLQEFLMTANTTKLVTVIDQTFLHECKTHAVFNTETPIEKRCQFLNDIILMRVQEKKNYEDVIAQINELEDCPFKEYAQTLVAILKPQQTYCEHFANRRKLKAFHKHNPEFIAEPEAVRSLSLRHFNAMGFTRQYDNDIEKVHISVVNELHGPILSEDLVLGYVNHDNDHRYHEKPTYRLYACDADDGDAVWATRFTSENKHPFVVHRDRVYCAQDDGTISIVDKSNGLLTAYIPTAIKEKIYSMHASDNTLFVAYKKQLYMIDLADGSEKTVQLPNNVIHTDFYRAHYTGQKTIFTHRETTRKIGLLSVDKEGRLQIIPRQNPEDIHKPAAWGNNQRFFYDYNSADYKTKNIVCLDSATNNKLWHYTTPSELACNPRMSPDGKTMFLLMAQELIALDTETTVDDQPKILWKTPVRGDVCGDINDIITDGNMVYGVNKDIKKSILMFDCKTGKKSSLYEMHEGRSHRLIGVRNGKLYIQPYSY